MERQVMDYIFSLFDIKPRMNVIAPRNFHVFDGNAKQRWRAYSVYQNIKPRAIGKAINQASRYRRSWGGKHGPI